MKTDPRLLVIEDHRLSRQDLVEAFSDPRNFDDYADINRFDVQAAGDGGSATQLLTEAIRTYRPYDVVLLDIGLPPDTDQGTCERTEVGLQLLKELHDKFKWAAGRVVILSINTRIPNFIEYLRAGAADFVAKPFKTKEAVPSVVLAFRKARDRHQIEWMERRAEQQMTWSLLQAQTSLADDLTVIVSDGIGDVLRGLRVVERILRERFQIDVDRDETDPLCRELQEVRKAAMYTTDKCTKTRTLVGSGVEQTADFNLNDSVDEVIDWVRPGLAWRRVAVRRTSEGEQRLRTLPNHWKAVVTEVVSNGLEASPSSGVIEVKTGGTEMCQVQVVDQGEPITDDVRDRINNGERVGQDEGRGWGLSLAQRAARNIACRLTCKTSTEGRNTITLAIPAARP